MKSLLCLVGCVAIALVTPWAAAASEPFRQARVGLMPPAVVIQITNATAAEVQVYIDGQVVGIVRPAEVIAVPAYPGYRFLEWVRVDTGVRGTARVEVPAEQGWQFTIR